MTVRVAMWSGPRNISTAMMRAWENRPDSVVVDEPFYASYLARTGIDHPGRNEVIASQPTDPHDVVRSLSTDDGADSGHGVRYAKQMTHHIADDMDLGWVGAFRNALLIRDPGEVVASYVRSRRVCEPADIGLFQQERLLAALKQTSAGPPPIIDAADFLRDPETHLRWLCDWLGIGFTDKMLHWPAGLRGSDGVWAPYWYDAVERSTGFEPPRSREVDLSPHDVAVVEACRPAYDAMWTQRLRLR